MFTFIRSLFFFLTDKTVTLSIVIDKLSPRLVQLKVLHKVFSTGVAEVPPDTRNVVRASHLLNTLYKAILEYDSVGEASEQTVGEIISSLAEWHTRKFSNLNFFMMIEYTSLQLPRIEEKFGRHNVLLFSHKFTQLGQNQIYEEISSVFFRSEGRNCGKWEAAKLLQRGSFGIAFPPPISTAV